jgi:hypothetical protein
MSEQDKIDEAAFFLEEMAQREDWPDAQADRPPQLLVHDPRV